MTVQSVERKFCMTCNGTSRLSVSNCKPGVANGAPVVRVYYKCQNCKYATHKAWHDRNLEHVREYAKDYYHKHRPMSQPRRVSDDYYW